jgi:hypothetical protein
MKTNNSNERKQNWLAFRSGHVTGRQLDNLAREVEPSNAIGVPVEGFPIHGVQ